MRGLVCTLMLVIVSGCGAYSGYQPEYGRVGLNGQQRVPQNGRAYIETPPALVSADVGTFWDPSRIPEIIERHRIRVASRQTPAAALVAVPETVVITPVVVPEVDVVTQEEYDRDMNALIGELRHLRRCYEQANCPRPP